MSQSRVRSLPWGALTLADSFRYLLSPELLSVPVPSVPRVDCRGCRRVEEGTACFEVRCCDITPVLPNFLIGEILESQEHSVVLSWIEERRGDPFAIWVPPRVAEQHLNARKDGRYGLACPLLVEGAGRCSIYVQRPALCVSYHCYYPDTLWQEAWACLASTLELFQDAASRYLVTTFDLDLQKFSELWTQEELELWEGVQQNLNAYQSCWQHWQGREREFYRRCYELLRSSSSSLRMEILDLHRQQLWDRLTAEGCLSMEQESLLEKEFDRRADLQLVPACPPPWLRLRLREGSLPAATNVFTLHQMESMLLWYLHQLQDKPWWMRWRRLREREEVKDLQGIQVRSLPALKK